MIRINWCRYDNFLRYVHLYGELYLQAIVDLILSDHPELRLSNLWQRTMVRLNQTQYQVGLDVPLQVELSPIEALASRMFAPKEDTYQGRQNERDRIGRACNVRFPLINHGEQFEFIYVHECGIARTFVEIFGDNHESN